MTKCLNCNRDYDQETQGAICPHDIGGPNSSPPWPKRKAGHSRLHWDREAQAVIPEVPDLYSLAFMPGQFRCPKCGFQLSKQTISVAQGCIGTTPEDRESVPCVNCDTMMVHVTYREQLEVYAGRLKEEFDRFDAHTKAVAEFLSELHAIMVDPFAEGTLKVDQMMLVLRAFAGTFRSQGQDLPRPC